jgi:hypothetical protein
MDSHFRTISGRAFLRRATIIPKVKVSVDLDVDENHSINKFVGTIKRYHSHQEFADRRYKVESARTYFYLNEAQCERNMEIFMRCLEAVSGNNQLFTIF